MKASTALTAAALVHLASPLLLAQGPLTPPGPPGPPAPNMKTLQQIEPRTDLATVPGDDAAMHVITAPGSYFLSGNLGVTKTNGIAIRASGVTLDLTGFTISRSRGGSATGTAIVIDGTGQTNIAIGNGHITGGVVYDAGAVGDQFTGGGFGSGIAETAASNPSNVRVSHVHVSGCDVDGINLSVESITMSNSVEHCSVTVVGGVGITAGQVHYSTAITCGASGIAAWGNVSHSHGESVMNNGIVTTGTVTGCYGRTTGTAATSHGIFALLAGIVDSRGESSGGSGLSSSGSVTNSYGRSTGTGPSANGISASGSVSHSLGVSSGDDGIDALTISYSYGESSGTGHGLECTIAVACTSSGGQAITHKYLMP